MTEWTIEIGYKLEGVSEHEAEAAATALRAAGIRGNPSSDFLAVGCERESDDEAVARGAVIEDVFRILEETPVPWIKRRTLFIKSWPR